MNITILFLVSFYLATRLFNLDLIPISNDEANYIFYAKNIAETNQGWFISLTNGKPPIFIWLIVLFLKILPSQWYLIAGRLPSVFTGLASLLGIYFLSRKLFSQKVAVMSALLYILSPFILFYDRMALFDSLLTATTVWLIYFMVTKNVFLWAITLGIAFWSKPTAIIYWAISPVLYLFLYGVNRKNVWSATFTLVISQLIHNLLIFSSGYQNYITRAFSNAYPDKNLFTGPLSYFTGNLIDTFFWLSSFLTPPVFLCGLIGLIALFLDKKSKICFVLLALWSVPIIIQAFFGRIYFPRYFLFTTPYLLIGGAFLIGRVMTRNTVTGLLMLFLTLTLAVRFDFHLLTDPTKAALPKIEDWQYVSGYPSSYGFDPIYQHINKLLKNGPVILFVGGSFSHFPHAFNLYYWGNPNIKIYERWPLTAIDQQMIDAKKHSQVYVVVRKNTLATENDPINELPLRILIEGKKPRGPDSVYLTTFD